MGIAIMIIKRNYLANRLPQMNSSAMGTFAHHGLKQKMRPAVGRLSPTARLVLAAALLTGLTYCHAAAAESDGKAGLRLSVAASNLILWLNFCFVSPKVHAKGR